MVDSGASTNRVGAEDSASARTVFVAATVGLVLLLQLAAPVTVAPRFWGLRTWEGVPFGIRALLFTIGLSLLTPSGARLFDALWFQARRSKQACIIALAVTAASLMLLRSKVMWGNPDIAVEDASRGRLTLKHTLATAVSAAICALLGRGNLSFGHASVALSSVFAGVLYFWGAFAFGAAAFPNSIVKARVVALTLATSGLSQQFFGVAESYPLACATQIWVLVCIARLARPKAEGGSDSATPAMLALSLSAGTFIATVFLGPATLIAIFRERARGLLTPMRKVLVPILAGIGPVALAVALLHVLSITRIGYRWPLLLATFGGNDGSSFVPLHETKTSYFTLFSFEHAAARANAAFLSVPAWIAVIASIVSVEPESATDSAVRRMLLPLGIGAAGSLSYYFLINPDLGPTLDWMETAAGSIAPLAFLLVLALARTSETTAARLGSLFVGLSVLHTLPWVIANAGLTGGAR